MRQIYCVGRNYSEHIREMGGDERELPLFFQKPTDAIVQTAPTSAGELAAEHVYGPAVSIDLTRRDVQVASRKTGRPWEIGKSFDQSAPCSAIVPLAGAALPTSGRVELRVNDEVRQQGDLAQLIWPATKSSANCSEQYRLEPGDLIFTGTPAGVGPMKPGDAVQARVDGAGSLTITIGLARAA